MSQTGLPKPVYKLLFILCGLVGLAGLFVPLMDNDAAHHANIALRMYQTGDYVNLVAHGHDYLDKPHLHFWLSALSFELFGANTFAYKFPSFLFALAGAFSVFRLGSLLYNGETGRLAALIFSTSFGFLLSLSDVRMDAILVSCIALSCWQLIALLRTGKMIYTFGAALSLALGFATKGHIAVFIPLLFFLIFVFQSREGKKLVGLHWFILPILFLLFISPVLYCFYLQFNLHPEKMVRGESGINGIRFILWDQLVDRVSGKMEKENNHDPFFFFHSWVVCFMPWAILSFPAVVQALRFRAGTGETASAWLLIAVLVLVSISKYQLPHYLNVLLPTSSLMVAGFLLSPRRRKPGPKSILYLQLFLCVIILGATAVLNAWFFPVHNIILIILLIFFLSLVFYFLKNERFTDLMKSIGISAASMLLFFLLANTNFYPQLLQYQAGNNLARLAQKRSAQDIYFWPGTFSSSFSFYGRQLRREFHDSILQRKTSVYLVYDQRDEQQIDSLYQISEPKASWPDYEVSMLDLKFLDPSTRKTRLGKMVLAEISK